MLSAALLSLILTQQFQEHVIATGLKGGYQVVAADLNHDGKPDLIALLSGMTELVWFENPGWQRHVLVSGIAAPINLDVWDMDGDGIPEIVLLSEFSNVAAKSIGIVSVLQHRDDPREPWSIKEIDRIPTSHRVRWADIDGNGKKVAVNAVLIGEKALAPDYRDHVPLVFYRPGEWKREMIGQENEGVMHGVTVVRWGQRDKRDSLLTASFSGIHLYRYDGSKWTRSEIAKGNPAPWPKSGSSDIAVGKDGKDRFLAAIEPWHGNELVMYKQHNGTWKRELLDDTLKEGHGVYAADLDGDGRDEIVTAARGNGVRIYKAGKLSQVLDAQIASASCVVADLNGDGRPDIACIGGATANLKWYQNVLPIRNEARH